MDVVPLEQRQPLGGGVVELDPVGELGVDRLDVGLDLLVEAPVVDDDAAVVGVELLADDPHGQFRLPVQQRGTGSPLRPFGLRRSRPTVEQAGHVGGQFVLGGVLGRGAHDEAVLGRLHPVEDLAQALALVVGQPLGDAVGLRVGDEHHEAAGQRHLLGEPGALVRRSGSW